MANPGLYRNPSAFPLGPEPNVPTITSSPGSGVTMVTPPTHPHTYYVAGSAPSAPFFSPAPQAMFQAPSAFPLGPEPNVPTVTSSPASGVTMVTPPTHPHTYYVAGSAPSAPFFSPAPQAMFQAPSAPPYSPVEAQQSSLVHHGYHPNPATPLNWHPPTPTVYPVLVSQAHPSLTHTATGDPTNTSQNNNGNNPSRRNARRNRTKRRASRRGRRRNTRRN